MSTFVLLPDPFRCTSAIQSLLMDAAGERVAAIFQAPKTGNIDRVLFRTGTVTTPQPLAVGLQTVDTSTGEASGSAYGGMVAGAVASPASSTQYEVTLGTPAAATKGNDVALVTEWSGSAGNLNIAYTAGLASALSGNPYVSLFTAAWAKVAGIPMAAVRYDDGLYYDCLTMPFSALTAFNIASNTAGFDEYGLRFTLETPMRLVGFWAYILTNAGSDYEAILYSGTTALLTATVDGDIKGTVNLNVVKRLFPSTYDLAANTEYRIALRPTTTAAIQMRRLTQGAAGYWNAYDLGTNCYLCKRLDQGAWTDDTLDRSLMGLIVEPIAASGGGGASVRRRAWGVR